MNADINVPQSKSVTIAFAVLRLSLLLYNTERVGQSWLNPSGVCSSSFRSYYRSVEMLSLALTVLSACMLLFLICSNAFRKWVFWLYYAAVAAATGYLLVASFLTFSSHEACHSVLAASHMVLFTCLAVNLLVLFVIALPFELAMKAANLGCCVVWPVFLFLYQRLLQQDCTRYHLRPWSTAFSGIIAWSHLAIIIVGYFTFTLLKLTYKTSFTARIWRVLMLASVLLMALCFVLAWLQRFYEGQRLLSEEPCTYQRFFLRVYQRHGWADMVAPILLMTFVRLENGDTVRDSKLKYTWGYPQPFVAPPL